MQYMRWHQWCVYHDILSHIAKYVFSFKFLNSLHRVRCERSLFQTILCSLELSSSHRCHRSCPKDRSISVCSSTSTRCQRKAVRSSPCRFTGFTVQFTEEVPTISWFHPVIFQTKAVKDVFVLRSFPVQVQVDAPKTWLREKDEAASTIKTLPDFTVHISLKQKSV